MHTATSEIHTWCVYWVVLHGRARAALFLSPFLSLSRSLFCFSISPFSAHGSVTARRVSPVRAITTSTTTPWGEVRRRGA